MAFKLDLRDPELFGKVAAEDEEDSIFASYQVTRKELARLTSDQLSDNLVVVSAFRGEGKSALLRMASRELKQQKKAFLNRTTSTTLSIDKASSDVAVLARLWKASIYNYIAKEVGSKIGFAWTDDAIGLVEFAQKEGFKSKPWLIGLFDRFKAQIPGGIDRKVQSLDDGAEEAVKRWVAENQSFWLFIDDVDANFKDTKDTRAKLMAFFQALREIRNETPSFKIRATIRPNIWAIIRSEYPDANKLNEYMVDLNWTEDQLRDLLAARIKAYFARKEEALRPTHPRGVIAQVFDDPMRWAGNDRPPHTVLNTLSRSRPRWMIEICKAAGARAAGMGRSKIFLPDIDEAIFEVGRERQHDLALEYEPQCKQIAQILETFSEGDDEYETSALFELIQKKLLDHLKPDIASAGGSGITPQVVTRLLFEIGFLTGKRRSRTGYTHISFADNVNLLSATGPLPAGITWEIHPIFRRGLSIKDARKRRVLPRSR